jgi:nucleotide-binding universal stress UspA family protein
MNILVAYDGTLNSKKALLYGINKVQKQGGILTVLQVFDWALYVDYEAGPRAEEQGRREAARHLEEARRMVSERGISAVRFVEKDGQAEDVALEHIEADRPDLVLATPRFRSLARRSSRPVSIIPGTILVPVDSSGVPPSTVAMILEESAASGSQVLLLGLVPVHLYSKEEKAELAKVTLATAAAVSSLREALAEQGIRAAEVIRAGYPDEEILKAAEEHQASLVLLPSGGATPSELTKAAAILLDEPERMHWPISVLPADTAA